MKYKRRDGLLVQSGDGQEQVLRFLYQTIIGRMILRVLIKPQISKIGGWLLNRRISVLGVKPFVEKNKIQLSDFEKESIKDYHSYNEFFCRKIKSGKRTVDIIPEHFIAPCDSKLSVYPITAHGEYMIKHTKYTMDALVRNREIAKHYQGGTLFLYRLTVDDYHRYCYVDGGTKSKNHRIPGIFHTVNPLANEKYPIYKENTREYTLLKSAEFGWVLQMEVGALMVGKITNYDQGKVVERGEEKGRFEFGGSTIIVCVEKDRVIVDEDILNNSRNDMETAVKYGERVGVKQKMTG